MCVFPCQLLGSLVPVQRECVLRDTLAKSRMRESRPYGSVRAKAEWLRYSTTGGSLQAFASPADWRDQWIYFLMVDRFNNSQAPPRHMPFDDPNYYDFQ